MRADAAPPRHAAGPSAVLLAALSTHTGISGGCGTCSPVSLSVCLCCSQLRYLWMGRGFACCSLCSWVDLFIGLCVCEGRSERESCLPLFMSVCVFHSKSRFPVPWLGKDVVNQCQDFGYFMSGGEHTRCPLCLLVFFTRYFF